MSKKDGKKGPPKPPEAPKTGFEAVVEMFDHMDEATRDRLIKSVAERDPMLAEKLERGVERFETLIDLDDRDLQTLIREVPLRTLALSLRKVSPELKEKIQSQMPIRLRETLEEEIQLLGPRRMSEVEAAQGQIQKKLKDLKAAGKIRV